MLILLHYTAKIARFSHSHLGNVGSSELANVCILRGITVAEQDDRHVVCSKEMSGISGVFAQALIGNSYSTTPMQFVRFSISNLTNYKVVQASQWIETQMAFGQVRREELNGKKQRQGLASMLLGLGGSTTPPTSTAPSQSPPSSLPSAPTSDKTRENK